MTPNGDSVPKSSTENDQGTGPATPWSPASLASDNEPEPLNPDDGIQTDDGGAAFEIENEYRRRLAGMRHLRRPVRAAAYRAAKEWFRAATVELREKRTRERQARALERRLLRRAYRPSRAGPN